MELSRLAEKQRRIRLWEETLDTLPPRTPLAASFKKSLDQLRSLLLKCWQKDAVSEEEEKSLHDLERTLESLNDESRLASA